MAASRAFQIFTAGVAFATAAVQIESQQRIKALESRLAKPTSHNELAPTPTHINKKDDEDPSPPSPDAPPMTSKARRELYEKLEEGRRTMIGYSHGIRDTCEKRCDELEGPCDIYEELQKLHEICKRESGWAGYVLQLGQ